MKLVHPTKKSDTKNWVPRKEDDGLGTSDQPHTNNSFKVVSSRAQKEEKEMRRSQPKVAHLGMSENETNQKARSLKSSWSSYLKKKQGPKTKKTPQNSRRKKRVHKTGKETHGPKPNQTTAERPDERRLSMSGHVL